MSWIPDRYRELRSRLRPERYEDDVAEELALHLELRIADLIAAGKTPDAARDEAQRRFGDLSKYSAQTCAIDASILRERKRMELMDTLRRELYQGARGLIRSPGFTLVAVITLALGIGASSAVFTLLKTVVLDPLPYPDADRIVVINAEVPGVAEDAEWGMSSASFFHFKDRSSTLEDIAVYGISRANLRAAGDAALGDLMSATPNLFAMLGAKPVIGRLFQEHDGSPDAPRVALLSYGYWQREFGGRADAIGSTITFDGAPAEIVGVVDDRFSVRDRAADVYLNRRMNRAGPHYNSHNLNTIAKVKPGVTLDAVLRDLRALNAQLPEVYPTVYYPGFMEDTKFAPVVRSVRESVVGRELPRVLWIVLGAVAVVLLIACANVANLFLVRAETKRNELAVRAALGAERAHIFVQSIAEAVLLTGTAGALAIWLAHGALRVLVRLAPEGLPRLGEVQLGSATILSALGVALLAGLLFALFPLLRGPTNYSALREAGRGLTASRRQLRMRSGLVAGQLALALVLLASAGLMLRTFQRMRTVELGFDPENVLTLVVSLPYAAYTEHAQVARFWEDFNTRIGTLPGVTNVSGTIALPMAGGSPCAILDTDPRPVDSQVLGCPAYNIVTPGYFETAGIKVRGRTPTWDDIHRGTGAVVISDRLAQELWPGEDPIGRGVRLPSRATTFYRIVGVAEDVLAAGVRQPAPNFVYYPVKALEGAPLWQAQNALVILVRTESQNTEPLLAGVRGVLRQMEPAAAIGSVEEWQTYVNQSMASTSFMMLLLVTAGGMALLLAVVGLYGTIAYVVSRRRSEIGVRMALGADRRSVGGMVVLQSLQLAAVGVTLGLLGAALTTQMLGSLLFEVTPTDPMTLTVVAFALLGVSALAAFVPARRAASVSPVDALRAD